MKKFLPFIFLAVTVIAFFAPFVFQNKLPIPSDTIVGLYHPFRDLYAKDYPNGITYKNFLITDPVRQQYPWRNLSIGLTKNISLPLWNPYSLSGTPLLAGMQSASFYPLNLLLFILPFSTGWSFLIFIEPLLAGIFLYLYLNNLKLQKEASLFGALVFAFCGFTTAWLEWGTVINTAVWLPLVLLSIDKIFFYFGSLKIPNFKFLISNKKLLTWSLIFTFSLASSFFAGHLQTFFYLILLSLIYLLLRWWQSGKSKKIVFTF